MTTDVGKIDHEIAMNFTEIHDRIAKAAQKWQRETSDIDLVAVSKRQPIEHVEAALRTGQRHFGENRVQDAQGKWPALKTHYPAASDRTAADKQGEGGRGAV